MALTRRLTSCYELMKCCISIASAVCMDQIPSPFLLLIRSAIADPEEIKAVQEQMKSSGGLGALLTGQSPTPRAVKAD
jgi:hypothetical protein